MAVAALAACNKAEIVDLNPGEAIEFGNAFVDNATKAEDPSYSANDITSFKVYGTVNGENNDVLIYPGTEVTKGSANYGAAWTCPIKQYWVPGATYKFIGIVDGDKADVSSTTLVNGMPTQISYKADGVTDILCTTVEKTANTDGTPNGIVEFTFSHLLAKAKFTVNNKSIEATNYLHKVHDIKITNAYNNATYNITSKEWIDKTNNDGGGQAFDNITAEAVSTESANEKLLIPGLESITVEFIVDLYYVETVDGVKKETLVGTTEYTTAKGTAKTANVKIEAGKAYDFNVNVAVGEPIQFTVKEQPKWTDNGDTTI